MSFKARAEVRVCARDQRFAVEIYFEETIARRFGGKGVLPKHI